MLLILSGPAGSGKTTAADNLLASCPQVRRVVTATTRSPRAGEVHQQDYHFLSQEAFSELIERGEVYEHATIHGRTYGTPRFAVDPLLSAGYDLLLVIDVQGAAAFRKAAQGDPALAQRLHTVFLKPRDEAQLRQRLAKRGTEASQEIERRMQTARQELSCAEAFDTTIETTTPEADHASLLRLYQSLRQQPAG